MATLDVAMASITQAASDGSTYRALWQLGPPGTGFSPPPAFARLVIQHVVGTTVTTLVASDWASDTANGATLSLIVWPDQRVTARATPAGSSSTLRLDVATPGISSTTTLSLGLVAVAEVSGHGASTFDDLSWTSASSRTAKHSTFDPFNIQTAEDVVSTDSTLDGRHRTFTYNAQGQLTARNLAIGAGAPAPEAGYGYDELDRLITSTVGGATTTYAYLGDSWLRRSATVGTTVTAWTYDGKNPLTQTVTVGGTAQPTTSYLHNGGTPLWEATSGTVLTYAHDPLGNVGGLVGPVTNGTTTVNAYARRFTYDAFGNVVREQLGQLDGSGNPILVTSGSAASAGLRYKGMMYDGGVTNLYKSQTRSYAPDLGRFTQMDPAKAGTNWFAYCGGDPVNHMDPSGLDDIEVDTSDSDHVSWVTDNGSRLPLGKLIPGATPRIQYGGDPGETVDFDDVKTKAKDIHIDTLGYFSAGSLRNRIDNLASYEAYAQKHSWVYGLFDSSAPTLDDFWKGNNPPLIPEAGWAATTAGTALYFLNQVMLDIPEIVTGNSADSWNEDQRKLTPYVDMMFLAEGARTAPRLLRRLESGGSVGAGLALAGGRGIEGVGGSAAGALGSKDSLSTLMAGKSGVNSGNNSNTGVPAENLGIKSLFGKTPQQVLKSVPRSWKKLPVDSGSGWKIVDQNGVERIRFMRPDAEGGKWAHTKTGYWRWQNEKGEFLDEYGQIVSPQNPDFNTLTHIPYSGVP